VLRAGRKNRIVTGITYASQANACSLVVSAVLLRDNPVIQGALLVIAGLYVLVNFAIDMLYLAVDPRVRY